MVDGDVMAIFTVQGWHFRVEDTNGELYDIIDDELSGNATITEQKAVIMAHLTGSVAQAQSSSMHFIAKVYSDCVPPILSPATITSSSIDNTCSGSRIYSLGE